MVKSWDCFDTLVARRYHYPRSIFHHIGLLLDDDNFINLRLMAERNTHEKTLDGIYGLLPKYDKNLELQTEKELTYPIVENFMMVEDGDIVVSDMYLSSSEILELLRYHGLNKDITVYSTYGGKVSGKIWDKIKSKHEIEYHIGDNLYSDVLNPRKYGINTLYYHGSNLSHQELLIERYSSYLSYWAKNSRLLNSYMPQHNRYIYNNGSMMYYYSNYWIVEHAGNISIYTASTNNLEELILYSKEYDNYIKINKNSGLAYIKYKNEYNLYAQGRWVDNKSNCTREDQKILWTEQSSFNIPILIMAIFELPINKPIVFSYRDCVYMEMLYRYIYPDKAYETLHISRDGYLYPYNQEYIEYLLKNTKNNCVVDLHGTGNSSKAFFGKYQPDQEILFVCEHADNSNKNCNNKSMNLCFNYNSKETLENTKFNHNIKSSKLGLKCCCGTTLEKFNISPDMGPLAGWVDNKPYRKKIEHDNLVCETFKRCVDETCSVSKYYRDNISSNSELLSILLKKINEYTYANSVIHSLWKK
jgi:hypothetical protein